MRSKSIPSFILLLFVSLASLAQPTAFTTCPNGNVAVVRASGSTANPISIYDINTSTGAATLLSGPILDPNNASINLQVNGLGLNEADGFLYGMFSDQPATLSTVPTTPYYRVGANAVAVQLGTLMGPPFVPGDNGSFVIPNAGEFDQSGTYYFPAITGFVGINPFNLPASTFTPSTFYIGALANSNTMPAGTGALAPTYVTITNPSNDAQAYIDSSSITITATNAQGLGLQDLVYNNADGNLYTYVSYANGMSGYFGQMLKINPSTGVLSAVAPPAVQPFLSANVFPNGMLIDANGNFLVMLTNGRIYKAVGSATNYTGALTLVNTTPGLPTPLTGDMASCGMITIALPDNSLGLSVSKNGNYASVQWVPKDETSINYFEIQYGNDGISFDEIGRVSAQGKGTYTYEHPNYFINPNSYYRLKVIHLDGSITYSKIRLLQTRAEEIVVYPNPTNGVLNIQLSKKWIGRRAIVRLTNQLGQLVLQKEIDHLDYEESIELDNHSISGGMYFLNVNSGGVTLLNKRIQLTK